METIAFICVTLLFKGVVTDERESVSVMEGDSITLHTDITEIKADDLIDWMFGDKQDVIARINRVANSLKINDDVLDGRFRGKLKLNNQTGDLTITDVTTSHTGVYQLHISRETFTIKTFSVYVFGDKVKTVMVGDSVILVNNVTKKPGDEKIMLRIRHNNSTVAEIIRNGKESNDEVYNERFRGRLQVDDQTGDLNITNITPDDSGSYELDITVGNNSYTIHRSFSVKGVDPQKDHLESNKGQGQSFGISLSSVTTGVICGVVLVVVAAAVVAVGFIIYRKHSRTTRQRVSSGEPLRTGSSIYSDVSTLYCDQHNTGFSMDH